MAKPQFGGLISHWNLVITRDVTSETKVLSITSGTILIYSYIPVGNSFRRQEVLQRIGTETVNRTIVAKPGSLIIESGTGTVSELEE